MPEPSVPEAQEPRNKFERLENRISACHVHRSSGDIKSLLAELEALLREKDQALSNHQSRSASTDSFFDPSTLFPGLNENFGFHDGSQIPPMHFPTASALDELAGVASLMGSPPFDTLSHGLEHAGHQAYPKSWGLDVTDPSWPRNLPNVSLLRQLSVPFLYSMIHWTNCRRIEAFFTFTPLAERLFHKPSFMNLLSLPTTHLKFPAPAILHAMCALGSMYTPDTGMMWFYYA